MSRIKTLIRTTVMIFIVLLLSFLCVVELFKLQIVDGDAYVAQSESHKTVTQTIEAARGQIVDSNGKVMNTNRIVYNVIVQKAYFTTGEENKILEKTVDILKANNQEWNDSLPISKTTPYEFTTDNDAVLDSMKEKLKLNYDATVDNCMTALLELYKVDDKYSDEMKRNIVGIRYEMAKKDFSDKNYFLLAEDVSPETVIEIKEMGFLISGVDIIEDATRVYLGSTTAPHEVGTVGAISEETYLSLKSDGYTINDKVGVYGIELAMEKELRGTNGTREITVDSAGDAINNEITQEAVSGNSVMLTIDTEFQNDLQAILENQINWLHFYDDPDRGNMCDAGAAVVLDVKTGAVLGMANYPNYDITELVEDYSKVLNTEGSPLINRATSGLYRPGSTFKSITATAGLIEKVITGESKITCNHIYTYFDDYQPKCTGTHGSIDVTEALKWSCNIFFYETGRLLGIDRLGDYAAKFGIGTDLGLEIGGQSGRMTSVEIFEELGGTWTEGNTIQTAIGQAETLVTPLHLAVQAMTLANNGVRYKPYLVKSVMNYDCSKTISETEPVIAEKIDDYGTDAFQYVREGMIKVSTNVNWPLGTTKNHFDGLPYSVAMKTGTPQVTETTYNSTVLAYYPAEDPQIAIGIVLEKGEFSRYMIRNIIDAYFYDCYEPDMDEDGNVISPWKEWSEERKTVR